MKSFLSLKNDRRFLFGRMMLPLLVLFAALIPTKAASDAVPGDVDGDGAITTADVTLIRDHALSRAPLTTGPLSRADANEDNQVEVSDVVWTGRHLTQTATPTPTPTPTLTSSPTPSPAPSPTPTATPTPTPLPVVIEMVAVSSGTFTMGRRDDGDDEAYGNSDELPRHTVTLPDYQIGKYQVTNGQYCGVLNWANAQGYLKNSTGGAYAGGAVYAGGQALLYVLDADCQIQYSGGTFGWKSRAGAGGTTFSMERHPVVCVTWYGAVAFSNWLSEKEGLTPCYELTSWTLTTPYPNGYRLPTEAEWERAAAWDGSKHWIYGFTSDTLTGRDRCNYNDMLGSGYVNPLGLASMPYTSPVGWFYGSNISPNGSIATVNSPSPVGCYDMSGNVWEWCQDWYHTDYNGAPTDGSSWETQQPGNPCRVGRGGSYGGWRNSCRSASRNPDTGPADRSLNLGFRLARSHFI